MTIEGRKCKTSDYSLYGRVENSIVVNVCNFVETTQMVSTLKQKNEQYNKRNKW